MKEREKKKETVEIYKNSDTRERECAKSYRERASGIERKSERERCRKSKNEIDR